MSLIVPEDSTGGTAAGSRRASVSRSRRRKPTNDQIATLLERIADLLEIQHASVHRVRAYRGAARSLRALEAPVADRVGETGADSLEALPGIGKSIAALIRELVSTGRVGLLERLEGQASPRDLFRLVPGIGESLAARVESELHVETLEDLEAAAHDGRLASVPGFGARRVRAVRDSLEHLLRFAPARGSHPASTAAPSREAPSVDLLLETDREYRERARRGELRTIAPRRFNPDHRSWLPVMHRDADGWSLTALFSNTARAHQLGRTQDWVVIYFERNGDEGQCTVVSEHAGRLAGRRVVRGREAECSAYYSPTESPVASSPAQST